MEDPEALGAMVSRYEQRLYRYLVRLVRDPAAAEDLFQQTWLKAVEKLGRYDPSRSFESWLFALAHNLAVDQLRRRRPDELAEDPPEPRPDVLQGLLEREQSARLQLAVAALPAVYREVVALRFEGEMKLEDIAEVTGAPLSTVKSRLKRALEGLRGRICGRAA